MLEVNDCIERQRRSVTEPQGWREERAPTLMYLLLTTTLVRTHLNFFRDALRNFC
jgi:hypothetical protein